MLNAVLYSMLLPLWEGFDEAFHYGYVQEIAHQRRVPDVRTSRLSREIAASFELAPASHVVKRNIPGVRTYAEYFALTRAERSAIRERLLALSPELKYELSDHPNYEAQHAPLAYMVLAIPEWLLGDWQFVSRVLVLRIVAGVGGLLLLLRGAGVVAGQLGVPEPFRSVALFCLMSSQMIWATVVHVTNDWLAVPLAVWLLAALLQAVRAPGWAGAIFTGLALAAGLLTKAYFLAFTAPALLVVWWRCGMRRAVVTALIAGALAGPWYVRNVIRYGNVSAMQESLRGGGFQSVASAALSADWPLVILSSARAALWTGNSSFTSFSAATLYFTLSVCLLAVVLWACRRAALEEYVAAGFTAIFLAALCYSAAVTQAFTGHAGAGASPWYTQVVVGPLLFLCALGGARAGNFGVALAGCMVLLFGYLASATYLLKLIPLYGGYSGRVTAAGVLRLYSSDWAQVADRLDSVALAPAGWILLLAAGVVVLVAAQCVLLVRRLARAC